MTPVLSVENLTFSYGNSPALEGVTFQVGEKRRLFILGENGSGKSTLLKLISGILSPSRGKVLFRGRDVKEIPRRDMARKIVLGTGNLACDFPVTVEEFVSLGRFPHRGLFSSLTRKDREAVDEALSLLGISSLRGRRVTDLSDGEKQKVSLAKMVAQDGEVYLFDEPGAHLDLRSRVEVFRLISSLTERGKTVVVTSHDIGSTLAHAQDVLLLKGGKVVS
ncbi:MAG: ABC transporter ATP-binding protein, partial [Deltaproteobacteria bacterium]